MTSRGVVDNVRCPEFLEMPASLHDRTDHEASSNAEVIELPSRARRCSLCGHDYPASFAVCPRDATPLVRENSDPLLGIVLAGTYRLDREIGRGGMGRLYEATHARLGRRFAVKVLHESHRERPETTRRFEREAQALARIRSDHVLDVIDVLRTTDQRVAIVTALLDGEDLQRRLDRVRRLEPKDAIEIARQLCRGLAAAHDNGVIHRDLKPSNIFLASSSTSTPNVKILDFGVAKLADESEMTRAGVVLGTPAYMAPEQARASHDADVRSDVYAVGAVLYRLVTGRMPYEERDVTATLAHLLQEAPARPRSIRREIPIGLEAVILQAMARDPEDRPADMRALETMLADLIDARESTVITRKQSESQRPSRRPLTLVAVQASIVLAMAAAAGAVLLPAPVSLFIESTSHRELTLALAIVGALVSGVVAASMIVRVIGPLWQSASAIESIRQLLLGISRRGAMASGLSWLAMLALSSLTIATFSVPMMSILAITIGLLAALVPLTTEHR